MQIDTSALFTYKYFYHQKNLQKALKFLEIKNRYWLLLIIRLKFEVDKLKIKNVLTYEQFSYYTILIGIYA